MKRFLTSLALLCSLTCPAESRNWYVSPNGVANSALATANTNAQPGDNIFLADGTYTTAPLPSRSGSAGARIRYIGNEVHRNRVQVPGATYNQSYITIIGVRFNGPVGFNPAGGQYGWNALQRDSIYSVNFPYGLTLRGVQHSSFTFFTVGNDTVNAQFGIQSNAANWAVRTAVADTFMFFNMALRTTSPSCGLLFEIKGLDFGDRVDSLKFVAGTIGMKSLQSNGSECQPVGIYRMSYSYFENVRWRHLDYSAVGGINHRAWRLRDESWYNRFKGCEFRTQNLTFTPTWIELTDSGANRGHGGKNVWERCTFVHDGDAWSDYGPIAAQNGFNSDTLISCTFKARNGANFGVLNTHGPIIGQPLIANNTFIKYTGPGLKTWTGTGSMVIRNNVEVQGE